MIHYPSYKNSGVEWIGEFPSHWGVSKLKYDTLTPVKYGMNISSDKYVDEGIRFIRITDLTDWGELIKDNGKYLIRDDVTDEFLLDKYDLLFCRSGHTVGKSYLHLEEGDYTSGGYLVRFNFGDYSKSKFIFYVSKTDFYWFWIQLNTVTSTIENVNGEKYSNMIYPKPPNTEQTQIVSFLDTKTQKIDELIEKTEKKIELLKGKRTSLINHCVTKGLNPNVEMKDSGVEWIGEVPSHWVVKKVKYLLNDYDGIKIGPFGSSLKLDTLTDSGIKIYGQGNIIKDDFRLGHRYLPLERFEQDFTQYEILDGDILVTMMGTTGKSKVFSSSYERGILDSHLLRLRFNKSIYSGYLFSILLEQSDYIFQQIKLSSKGSIMEGLNSTIIKELKVLNQPIDEQTQIVEYLDEQTQKIDFTIEKEIQRTELLKEYRQSLISRGGDR